jgi:hypothetical protein
MNILIIISHMLTVENSPTFKLQPFWQTHDDDEEALKYGNNPKRV